jgi:N-acetyl-1-D-myo-inositol-2-amino-2-deoxy-alpha-D-glucopyranoside deacetylase
MVDVRRVEMADAMAALGGPQHHWLGYRDSGMMGEPSNEHADAFHGAELDEAAGRLARIVRTVRPHVVVSDDELGTYGHPDHIKAYAVTARAVELAADPAWEPAADPVWRVPKRYVHTIPRGRMFAIVQAMAAAGLPSPFGDADITSPADLPFGSDDDAVTTLIDVTDVLERKQAAMAAHRSQIGEESFFLNTPAGLGSEIFGREAFVLLDGVAAPDDDGLEHDVFAGVEG